MESKENNKIKDIKLSKNKEIENLIKGNIKAKNLKYKNNAKNKHIYKITLMLLFIFFVGFIFIVNIITPSKDFSEEENKKLQQRPKFSLESLEENRFTKKYEKYISDQFLLRNTWISIKSEVDKLLGKKESNDVFLGKEGYLFQKFKKPKEEETKEKIDALNRFSEKFKNINKYIMIVPNSYEIIKEKLPKNAPVIGQLDYINEVKDSIKDYIWVDTYNELLSNKDKDIYYKTDHHWTTKGAYYGYKSFEKVAKLSLKDEDNYNILKVTDNFYGTSYSRGGFRGIKGDDINIYLPKEDKDILIDYIEENKKTSSLYDTCFLNKKDKYGIFLGGNHSLVRIKTLSDSDRKLIVFKDSYANSMIPFLTEDFSEILMVDLRYYMDDVDKLIDEEGITDSLVLYNGNTFFQDDSISYIS
ncbi:DHHW family protein [Clostridium fallax]|uniref:DHHW protein n=1 Tax=Clostridium fallax TaxID=1533 RepID=A0A1M4SZQ1_9CLOT|nr:DHHW family protein [Clostridium fallax]SHE37691.1 DHHW protein [Clostridium fallax]SQB08053.1 membrane protein [Clostridium fallax]